MFTLVSRSHVDPIVFSLYLHFVLTLFSRCSHFAFTMCSRCSHIINIINIVLILFARCSHFIPTLFSRCSHFACTLLTRCSQLVFKLMSTLLSLSSHFVLTLFSFCFYNVRTLLSLCSHVVLTWSHRNPAAAELENEKGNCMVRFEFEFHLTCIPRARTNEQNHTPRFPVWSHPSNIRVRQTWLALSAHCIRHSDNPKAAEFLNRPCGNPT